MASKRPAPQVHSSRQGQVPGEPKRKRQKPDNAGPKSFKKAHPVNELKSQIRSLKRLLQRDEKLPGTVRMEKERQLQTAERELEDTYRGKQKSDMIGRYHKIRFFDKQKATKRLKRTRKELIAKQGDATAREVLGRRVDEREVDVNYAQYFPLDRHYISLFPRKAGEQDGETEEQNEKDSAEERKGDVEMWQLVKKCMEERTLDDLRHGRLTEHELGPLPENVNGQTKTAGATSGKTAIESAESHGGQGHEKPVRANDDDERGGGFFE